MTRLLRCSVVLAGMATALSGAPVPVLAQGGTGTTAATVLQLPAGGRAAGFGGAYTAASDGDVVFYNPAGAAWLSGYAGMAYQRHAEEIGFATAAAAVGLGPAAVQVTLGVLDYGSVPEVVPDPAFGGQRGMETGNMVGASDVVARFGAAVPLLGRRLAVGASAGLLWSMLAESARTTTVFDAGAQYRAGHGLVLGAALRNAGGPLTGANLVAAELPTELRGGVAWALPARLTGPLHASAHFDLIERLNEGGTAAAFGAEAGISRPARGPTDGDGTPDGGGATPEGGLTAVLRAGYNGAPGPNGVGRVHVGAGLALGAFGLDYTVQDMGVLGITHRVGIRWNGMR
jgi:hypothetical protein